MIDLNLIGNMVTSSQPNYIPVLTQLVIGVVTVGGTLGAVLLANRIAEKNKSLEKDAKEIDCKKRAYQYFLDAFSTNLMSSDRDEFLIRSGAYMGAALRAVEFGNVSLPEAITLHLTTTGLGSTPPLPTGDRKIQSLSDLIKVILEIRYATFMSEAGFGPDADFDIGRQQLMGQARKIGAENFGELLLNYLIKGDEVPMAPKS